MNTPEATPSNKQVSQTRMFTPLLPSCFTVRSSHQRGERHPSLQLYGFYPPRGSPNWRKDSPLQRLHELKRVPFPKPRISPVSEGRKPVRHNDKELESEALQPPHGFPPSVLVIPFKFKLRLLSSATGRYRTAVTLLYQGWSPRQPRALLPRRPRGQGQ